MRVVRSSLRRHGVPESDAFLEFHAVLAGYVEPAGRDEFVYGIVHHDSQWFGSLAPDAEQYDGMWFASYADAHPSYERRMDEHGVMYQEGGAKRAASFRTLVEQHAYIADFWKSAPVRRQILAVPTAEAAELRAHLDSNRIAEICDDIADVWAGPGWRLLSFGKSPWQLWSTTDADIADLAPFIR